LVPKRELTYSARHKKAIRSWMNLYANLLSGEHLTSVAEHSPVFKWDVDLARLRDAKSPKLNSTIKERIPAYQQKIATDVKFVREQYAWMRPFRFPQPEKIDERWLLFRAIQCQLLVHLDSLRRRLDNRQLTMLPKEALHDLIDYDYCLVAAQIGTIATLEKAQHNRFRLLRPGGLILTYQSGQVCEIT
jgi:hypothetical protein